MIAKHLILGISLLRYFVVLFAISHFTVIAGGPDEDAIKEEVSFVTKTMAKYGFEPQAEGIVVFRGDSRSPEEINDAGGFFRKSFGDQSKPPSFRVDGGARNFIGFSRDIKIAMGFAKYNVNVQREEQHPEDAGWVYAAYLPPHLYYDATNYPHAFLADWGKEVDGIYAPFNQIIGAIKVSNSDSLCIHCYLTRIVQDLHSIRGCKTPYVDQFILSIEELWLNPSLAESIPGELIDSHQGHLKELCNTGKYSVILNQDSSEEAARIAKKYTEYFEVCSAFSHPDKDLTVLFCPHPMIKYIPNIL